MYMKKDIVKFLETVCAKFNLTAIFIPSDKLGLNDIWNISTKNGHSVMTFTTKIFYDIPPRAREQMFLPTIKRGLNNLVAQIDIKRTQQSIIPRKFGKKIC